MFGAGELGLQDLEPLVREAGFVDATTGELPMPRVMGIPGAGWIAAKTRPGPAVAHTE
jgi:hypothetical protein